MPAELLERPVVVEEVPPEIPKATAIGQPIATLVEKDAAPEKSLWRKIFEGHEKFLGCTPD
jgi:hypothetical protein